MVKKSERKSHMSVRDQKNMTFSDFGKSFNRPVRLKFYNE